MTFAGSDVQVTLRVNVVNKPIFFINAATVAVSVGKFFGIAKSAVDAVTFDTLYKQVDFLQNIFVMILPIKILLERFIGEDFIHCGSHQLSPPKVFSPKLS